MAGSDQPFGTYALQPFAAWRLRCAQKMPKNQIGRKLALALRKSVLWAGPAVIDATVDGLKMRLHMRDNVSERKFLFMPQFFDRLERDLLKSTLKPGDVFVDIGANAGIYSLTAAALVGAQGTVLAIEPNPVMVERLQRNAALNNFLSYLRIEAAAVSDKTAQLTMTLDATNLGGSSLVLERSQHAMTVPCDTLVNILARHRIEKITALKIDIEGAEDSALVPFLSTADKKLFPDRIIIEDSTRDWKKDLPTALHNAGYVLVEKTRMNLIWKRIN
jgi:FkbM family methyltransferase